MDQSSLVLLQERYADFRRGFKNELLNVRTWKLVPDLIERSSFWKSHFYELGLFHFGPNLKCKIWNMNIDNISLRNGYPFVAKLRFSNVFGKWKFVDNFPDMFELQNCENLKILCISVRSKLMKYWRYIPNSSNPRQEKLETTTPVPNVSRVDLLVFWFAQ